MPVKNPKSMDDLITTLREQREHLQQGGGPERLAKQKEQGKLTARERVAALVDEGSFEEFGLFAQHRQTNFGMANKEIPADGVVTGAASVDGRLVHLASQDFTVLGGSAGEVHSLKVADVMQRSIKTGSPFVFINDSGGARVQEGIDSLSGLWPGFLLQRTPFWRGAADFADLWPLRRRRRILAGAYRFHHSNSPGANVYHRSAGDEAGHRRRHYGRSTRRR